MKNIDRTFEEINNTIHVIRFETSEVRDKRDRENNERDRDRQTDRERDTAGRERERQKTRENKKMYIMQFL